MVARRTPEIACVNDASDVMTGLETAPKSSNRLASRTNKTREPRPKFQNFRLATLNIETLPCDIELANYVEAACDLGLYIFALQEVRRAGDETLCFDGTDLESVPSISPDVELVEIHPHWNGRLLYIRVVVAGMKVAMTCVYAPTEVGVASTKA